MTEDPDLRARLERLAANAGDPPERGLERVAARRHRRLRRRRGAVVTAAALAVLLGIVVLLEQQEPRPDDLAVSPARGPAGAPAQLPKTVEVRCTPGGIEIPVASVRPQRDGLHVRVINELATETRVRVTARGWSSGWVTFEPGVSSLRQPVPPGVLTIGCDIAGRSEKRTVELNDIHGYYRTPELACPSDEQDRVSDLPAEEPVDSMVLAATSILRQHGYADESDEIEVGPVRGYVGARLGDPTVDPEVQVERDGEVVAFVYLRGAQGEPEGPWVRARLIEGCRSFFDPAPEGPDTTETTDTTEATAP